MKNYIQKLLEEKFPNSKIGVSSRNGVTSDTFKPTKSAFVDNKFFTFDLERLIDVKNMGMDYMGVFDEMCENHTRYDPQNIKQAKLFMEPTEEERLFSERSIAAGEGACLKKYTDDEIHTMYNGILNDKRIMSDGPVTLIDGKPYAAVVRMTNTEEEMFTGLSKINCVIYQMMKRDFDVFICRFFPL